MTLQEIKTAVDNGKTVHWSNEAYAVIKDRHEHYLIECSLNGHCIGLEWADGKGMNGEPDEFYIN